jgi:predicted nucleic acid-binding protein
MMMTNRRLVLDTNVIIRHDSEDLPRQHMWSAVVLQELAAGAADTPRIRELRSIRLDAEVNGLLLTADSEDWVETGRILNALQRGAPSRRSARPLAIARGEQQRLVRDVLIARSARRVNAAVVTYNRGDFEKIRRFRGVRVVAPAEIF